MGYITLLAILITITLLATKKLPMLSNLLPTWFASPTQNPEPKGNADGEDAGGEETAEATTEAKKEEAPPATAAADKLAEDTGKLKVEENGKE